MEILIIDLIPKLCSQSLPFILIPFGTTMSTLLNYFRKKTSIKSLNKLLRLIGQYFLVFLQCLASG